MLQLTHDFQDDLSLVSRAVNGSLLGSNDAPSMAGALMMRWTKSALERGQRDRGCRWGWDRNAVLGDIPKLVEGKGELEIYEIEFQPVIPKP
ncbi:Dimeric alpha-beta barrel [Penicillium fimorum]|uniref:Dimeric alpha-beta barrel n=1 Tax=Penicillium fimorum TaxID=1882269 RepID=A0A9W9XK83_9EURO|nr:Dimeric alpha-beta barrel [Penicillium fimorum]